MRSCLAFGVVLLCLAALPVAAQNLDVIKARKEALKTMGKATKDPAAMLKGEEPFDAAKVQAALRAYMNEAPGLVRMFPDDSKTGGDTEVLPAIWDNKPDFEGRYTKLGAAAKAAAAAITDEVSFLEEFPKVVEQCAACHKKYRVKK